MAHFVTFLFDSQERSIAEGSVAFTPDSMSPANLSQWKYGKRLCVTGTIAMITRSDVATGKRFVGRLVAASGDADTIEFVALGTTGDLLRGSAATLCGAVVGLRGDAPVLVGLFDLPENRSPLVEQ